MTEEAPAALSAEFVRDWFRRWAKAWNTHDAAAVLSLTTEEVLYEDQFIFHEARLRGHGALRAWMEATWKAFPDLRFQIQGMFIALDGGRAALQWKGAGTMRGRLDPPGYAPTGRPIEMRGTDVFEFEGERVSHIESSSEAFAVARQVGALPPAGRLPGLEGLQSTHEALLAEREKLLAAVTLISRRLGQRTGLLVPSIPAAVAPHTRSGREATRPARRRTPAPAPASTDPGLPEIEEVGRLRVDRGSRSLRVDGHEVALAPREFELLSYLLDHREQPVTREKLLRAVWGQSFSGDSRTLRVHINVIRAKLALFVPAPIQITTVHRVGYRLDCLDPGSGRE